MSFPSLFAQLVEKRLTTVCRDRIPPHVRNQIRMSFTLRGYDLILFEERRQHLNPGQWRRVPIGRIRYSPDTGEWTHLEQTG